MKIVIIGLSITSSWGNGHATTYRSLVAGLAAAGHRVLFLEQDQPWYAAHRDLPDPPYCRAVLYDGLDGLHRHLAAIEAAELVIAGSFTADGPAVCQLVQQAARGVTAFYDIDTPVTLDALARGDCTYLTPALIPGFDLYLSFTGGPTLGFIEQRYGAKAARPLYCSAEPGALLDATPCYDLGYLGTYSPDRQPGLEALLCEPARRWPAGRFAVTGPQYPADIVWPANVTRRDHAGPDEHAAFYASQRWTLNITRAAMVAAGYSPSVRLFEAAACGTPIISDWWDGLDTLLQPGAEIMIAASPDDTLRILRDVPDSERRAIAARARARVLASHTGAHRAAELVQYVAEAAQRRASAASPPSRLRPSPAA